ncbi:MAG: class I SAM-dependent methyltransferase [Phycisphaerae bacterium]
MKRFHIDRAIRRHVPEAAGKALLEAGCGVGLMTPAYVQLGFDVVAVDFSPTAIEEARKRTVDAQFVRSRLAELELNRTFDVITVIDVLLHIVDDDEWLATLEVLARHLTHAGVMIVLDWIGEWVGPLGDHCRIRPMSRYVAALADVGLRIDAAEQFRLEHEDVRKDLLTIRHVRD